MYIHFYAFIYDCVLFNGLTPVYSLMCSSSPDRLLACFVMPTTLLTVSGKNRYIS